MADALRALKEVGGFAMTAPTRDCCKDGSLCMDGLMDALFDGRHAASRRGHLLPSTIAAILDQDVKMASVVSPAERARALMPALDPSEHLDEGTLIALLQNLDKIRSEREAERASALSQAVADAERRATHLVLAPSRTHCIKCGALLPDRCVVAEEDKLTGSGSVKSAKATSEAVGWTVWDLEGKKNARRWYKRCDTCNILHYHDHAVVRVDVPGTSQPITKSYHIYADVFDKEDAYFTITDSTVVRVKILEKLYEMQVDGALSMTVAARLLGVPDLADEAVVHDAVPKFAVLRLLRDTDNPTRCAARRGLGGEIDVSQDAAFERRDVRAICSGKFKDYCEDATHPGGELADRLMRWQQHKCKNQAISKLCVIRCSDGNMFTWRRVCKYCWKRPADSSVTCSLGDIDGHAVQRKNLSEKSIAREPPRNWQSGADAADASEKNADDDLFVHDPENWDKADSDDDDDDKNNLTEAQENAGYAMLGTIWGKQRTVEDQRQVYVHWRGYDGNHWEPYDVVLANPALKKAYEERSRPEQPLYVGDLPPGPLGTKSRPNYNVFSAEDGIVNYYNDKDTEEGTGCNTHKDTTKLTRAARTAGIFCQFTMCGICHHFMELYKSEGKTMVCLAGGDVLAFAARDKRSISMMDLYDDACHRDARASSLMGQSWEMAALAIMDHPTEKLHFSGHVDPDCVNETDPYKRPHLLTDTNSPVCEQRFSQTNKFAAFNRGKDGGTFRAFYICMLDHVNARYVVKPPRPTPNKKRVTINTVKNKVVRKERKTKHDARHKKTKALKTRVPDGILELLEFYPHLVEEHWNELKGGILHQSNIHGAKLPRPQKLAARRDLRLWYLGKHKEYVAQLQTQPATSP
mmetsp:Transcript_19222/g.62268  ORF Transcript_19222/g.62268 Transcript_19222/m.62268 type:complete len:864 (+) Transcript_19222:15-2606(+)